MTEAEIDEFMDDALSELEEIRIDAKKALSRGSFTLRATPLSRLKPAEAAFRALSHARTWNVGFGSLAEV